MDRLRIAWVDAPVYTSDASLSPHGYTVRSRMRVIASDGFDPAREALSAVSAVGSDGTGVAQAGLAWQRRISGTVVDGAYEYVWHFPGVAGPNPGVYAVDEICLFVGEGGADDCRPASGEEVVSFVVPPRPPE